MIERNGIEDEWIELGTTKDEKKARLTLLV